jgi:hypothetical protein
MRKQYPALLLHEHDDGRRDAGEEEPAAGGAGAAQSCFRVLGLGLSSTSASCPPQAPQYCATLEPPEESGSAQGSGNRHGVVLRTGPVEGHSPYALERGDAFLVEKKGRETFRPGPPESAVVASHAGSATEFERNRALECGAVPAIGRDDILAAEEK